MNLYCTELAFSMPDEKNIRDNGTLSQLREGLLRVIEGSSSSFSGTGLVILEEGETIANFPMISLPEIYYKRPVFEALKEISLKSSPYHDGFHILDANLNAIQFCAFLSPAIDEKLLPDVSIFNFSGSRGYTAYFASLIPEVRYTAIASQSGSIRIFARGKEIA